MNTKDIEEIVEQYAQSIQDMYFLEGARISVETWKNTKDFVRNAITTHRPTPDIQQIATAVKDRYAECNGSYTPSELYEEVLKVLTTLTQHHEAEVERAVEATYEHILTELHSYNNHSECDPEWHDGFSEAIDKVEELQALTPTKTDKQ